MLDVTECLYCGDLGLNRDLDLLGIDQMDDHFALKMSVGLAWFSDEILRRDTVDLLGKNGSGVIKRRCS